MANIYNVYTLQGGWYLERKKLVKKGNNIKIGLKTKKLIQVVSPYCERS